MTATMTRTENLVRTDYGPGQSYLGGATPHVARNEGLEDVAITFVYRAPAENPGQAVPAPTRCELR